MNFKEWIGENIVYRIFGCFYANGQQHVFDFTKSKIPRNFLGREVSDLGAGDGTNTLRVRDIFKAKSITAYNVNKYLTKKAKEKDLDSKTIDLDKSLPKGEMATFIYSLHHAKNTEWSLKQARNNFDYLFLLEPMNDLYHQLFDGGKPLNKEEWTELFDKVLGNYKMYQYKNNLLVFYNNPKKR